VAMRNRLASWDASSSRTVSRGESEFEWYRIWQLKVPNKVKKFMSHFAHNNLLAQRNLARCGVLVLILIQDVLFVQGLMRIVAASFF